MALPALHELNDRIVLGTGAIDRQSQRHPAAEPFVAFLVGPLGQNVITQGGFLPRTHAMQAVT